MQCVVAVLLVAVAGAVRIADSDITQLKAALKLDEFRDAPAALPNITYARKQVLDTLLPNPSSLWGNPLLIPRSIHSNSDGVLDVTLVATVAPKSLPSLGPLLFRMYNESTPGPTLRLRKGGTLNVRMVNALGPDPVSDPSDPESCYPFCEIMNTFRKPNTTNFHTHGLHVSSEDTRGVCPGPDCILGDNVLVEIPPGAEQRYSIKLHDEHHSGSNWYHPHVHGSSSIQVGGGMNGMIIVEDPPAFADQLRSAGVNAREIPLIFNQYFFSNEAETNQNPSLQWYNKIEQEAGDANADFNTKTLKVEHFEASTQGLLKTACMSSDACGSCDKTTCKRMRSDDCQWFEQANKGFGLCGEKGGPVPPNEVSSNSYVGVNGGFLPKLTMERTAWHRVRLLNAGYFQALYLNFPGCEFVVLAYDGVYLDKPRPSSTTESVGPFVFLAQGARADILIKCDQDTVVYSSTAGLDISSASKKAFDESMGSLTGTVSQRLMYIKVDDCAASAAEDSCVQKASCAWHNRKCVDREVRRSGKHDDVPKTASSMAAKLTLPERPSYYPDMRGLAKSDIMTEHEFVFTADRGPSSTVRGNTHDCAHSAQCLPLDATAWNRFYHVPLKSSLMEYLTTPAKCMGKNKADCDALFPSRASEGCAWVEDSSVFEQRRGTCRVANVEKREKLEEFRTETLFLINNETFSEEPSFYLPFGEYAEFLIRTEMLDLQHPFHMHIYHQQIVGCANKNTPEAEEAYVPCETKLGAQGIKIGDFRDTVAIPLGVEVITRVFLADYKGDVIMHCHILFHEDRGMMTLMRTVDVEDMPKN